MWDLLTQEFLHAHQLKLKRSLYRRLSSTPHQLAPKCVPRSWLGSRRPRLRAVEGLALWDRGVVEVCWCGGARGACGHVRLWRRLVVAARPNAASFTSGRVGRLQQGHALGAVLVLRPAEGCFATEFEVQPGAGLDQEAQALVVAKVCGQEEGRGSVLLVG